MSRVNKLMLMTGNKYLLDTNIVIEYFRNRELMKQKVLNLPFIVTNSIIVGELFVGISRVVNKQKEQKLLLNFIDNVDFFMGH